MKSVYEELINHPDILKHVDIKERGINIIVVGMEMGIASSSGLIRKLRDDLIDREFAANVVIMNDTNVVNERTEILKMEKMVLERIAIPIPFEIEPKKRHQPKGHERPYKYHK